MKNKIIQIAFLGSVAALFVVPNFISGCKESPSSSTRRNLSPETHLWVDTIGSIQTSQVTLHWWGDDPDGFILGYLVTIDGVQWHFTTANESTFVISTGDNSLDTAKIFVAAVDQEGNGRYDASVISGGINFGGEAFVDADSNHVYSLGETYYDYGAIDPSPSRISVVVKNTPPVVSFDVSSKIPAKTLPVATVLFTATDVDGSNTVRDFYVALNDTADTSWTKIPNTVSMLTLVGDLSDTTANVVSARLKSGVNADDINISIDNLRLNQNNVLYLYATDITGAKSQIIRMPDTAGTWFVQKPHGRRKLLLVDDYSGSGLNPDGVYKDVMDSTVNSQGVSYGDYDVLDLIGYPISSVVAKPMITESIKLFNMIFWYANIANFKYSQESIPSYIENGGKVIYSSGFGQLTEYDAATMSFLPIDSMITAYRVNDTTVVTGLLSRVNKDSRVLSEDSSSFNPHPHLIFDRTQIFRSYAVQEGPTDKVLYRLDSAKGASFQEYWTNNPAVGVQSNNGRLIFFSVPLHLMRTYDPADNYRSRLVKLFERIFKGDFGD